MIKDNKYMRNREFKWVQILHLIRFRHFHIIKEAACKENGGFFWALGQGLWYHSQQTSNRKKAKRLRSKRQQRDRLRRWTLLLSDHKEPETLPSQEGFQDLDPSCEVAEGLELLGYLEFGDLVYSPSH